MWSDELQQPTLVRQQAFFAGAWRDADNQQTLDVINPASGERLATIPALGAPETTRAIEYAEQARHKWAKTPNAERAALLETWYQLIMANADTLARIMTAEQGKPLA